MAVATVAASWGAAAAGAEKAASVKKEGTTTIEAPGARRGRPAAHPRVRSIDVDLPDDSPFAAGEGRKLLEYIVGCALDAGVEARLTVGGEKVTYRGYMGFAPHWTDRALTLTEQRWVSACLYSRFNKFGVKVMISQRGDHPKVAPPTITKEEREGYPLHEGGYFGNVFLPQPVAYVCTGADNARMLDFPVGKVRRCAQPSGATTADGRPVSECQFVITGPCASPASATADGVTYAEIVHVWLSKVPHQ